MTKKIQRPLASNSETDLSEANLRYADLREADLREAELYGANLSHTRYSDNTLWPKEVDYINSGAILKNE